MSYQRKVNMKQLKKTTHLIHKQLINNQLQTKYYTIKAIKQQPLSYQNLP